MRGGGPASVPNARKLLSVFIGYVLFICRYCQRIHDLKETSIVIVIPALAMSRKRSRYL
jgi:hypothetical protein